MYAPLTSTFSQPLRADLHSTTYDNCAYCANALLKIEQYRGETQGVKTFNIPVADMGGYRVLSSDQAKLTELIHPPITCLASKTMDWLFIRSGHWRSALTNFAVANAGCGSGYCIIHDLIILIGAKWQATAASRIDSD